MIAAVLLLLAASPAVAAEPGCPERPLVIAHRGASGDAPEHSMAAYELAILQGADVLEPDLVMTKDGVLVARHENEFGETTDVAKRPEFASRRTTRSLDGWKTTGWFVEDFSWAELQTVRARERIPDLRPANTRFDGMFPIVSFRQLLERIAIENRRREGRAPIGIAPELKHTTHHRARNLDPVPPLLELLSEYGYTERADPVWVQSFEVGVLRELRPRTRVRLLQLVEDRGAPPDVGPDGPDFDAMMTPAGLKEIATYADAIGVNKSRVLSSGGAKLVRSAHQAGLEVHAWTFRAENRFLTPIYRRGGENPAARGDLEGEVRAAFDRCVDAVFADHPFPAVRARDAALAR